MDLREPEPYWIWKGPVGASHDQRLEQWQALTSKVCRKRQS